MNQIQILLIIGLFLAISFNVCVGRPKSEAKAMKEFADALIQGTYIVIIKITIVTY